MEEQEIERRRGGRGGGREGGRERGSEGWREGEYCYYMYKCIYKGWHITF